MNKQRLSGIVLIISFIVLVLFAFLFTPPNLYQEKDIEVRMQIVEDYQSKFIVSQIGTAVSAAGIAAGYLLLTLHLQKDKTLRLASIGAAAMLLATVSLAILMLQGIMDPRAYLERASAEGSPLSIFDKGFTWFTIAGYLIYGTVFLRGDFPKWLAYFTLIITILVATMAFFIATAAVELLFVVPLVVGIVLLRRSKEK